MAERDEAALRQQLRSQLGVPTPEPGVPLSAILLAYAAAQWVSAPLGEGVGAGSNRLGLALQIAGPAQVDQAVSIPLVTGVVWFCLRDRFTAWIAAVLTLTTLGVGGYIGYPAAPPWLASDSGQIGTVDRISSLGWDYLRLDLGESLTVLGQDGNPVAAMPPLHAGIALLVALFFWSSASTLWRAGLLGYAMLMAVTLVYTGEHYVVDVVAGWLTAGVAITVGAAVRRSRSTPHSYGDTDATGSVQPPT